MIPARLLRLLSQTATIVSPVERTDRYGNTVTDWENATRVETPCWVEQRSADEDTDQRSQLVATWLLLAPPGVEIGGRDRVEFEGKTFEVVGPSETKRTPRGAHHVEALLRWTEG